MIEPTVRSWQPMIPAVPPNDEPPPSFMSMQLLLRHAVAYECDVDFYLNASIELFSPVGYEAQPAPVEELFTELLLSASCLLVRGLVGPAGSESAPPWLYTLTDRFSPYTGERHGAIDLRVSSFEPIGIAPPEFFYARPREGSPRLCKLLLLESAGVEAITSFTGSTAIDRGREFVSIMDRVFYGR